MAISVPFTGGCSCGAIRYECSVEPILSGNCHCRDCQRASGGAYSATMIIPKAAFTVTKGQPKHHDVTAKNGLTARRFFCADCGSPLFAHPPSLPDCIGLRAGSLDDPSVYQPTMDIFTDSAQPWDYLNPDIPKFGQQPTDEEFQAVIAPRS